MTKKEKMDIFCSSGIYLVTSTELSNYPTLHVLERALEGGCKLFQLREKTLHRDDFVELGLKARKLADEYNAVFIINDYVDIAVATHADGVHLGQDDMPIDLARSIAGDDSIIGISTHNVEEVIKAQESGADYINIGPVFTTPTKPDVDLLGIEGVEYMLPYIKIPFTLMGGIKEEHIPLLVKYKPAAISMITEITKSSNVRSKVKRLLELV